MTSETNLSALMQLREKVDEWVNTGGTHYSAAAKIGIHPTALSHMLKGLPPTPRQIAKVFIAFGIEPESWGAK